MEKEIEKRKDGEAVQLPISRAQKIITTCAVFYGNVTFGCAMNAYGPSLTDFTNKYDTETSTISVVFTINTACYMVGALLSTLIFRMINRQLCVAFLFTGIAITMFISPHLPTLTLFFVVGGVLGFCMGCYDVAHFVWIMEMWQSKSGPFIQAQHFFFSVGSMLPSLIMSPFLTHTEDDDDDTTTTTTTTTTGSPEEEEELRLFIPFTIIGCLCVLTAVFQVVLFIFMRYRPPPPEEFTNGENNEIVEKTDQEIEDYSKKNWFQKQWPGWPIARLVILSALIIGFDQGMEMCTMQLFPTYGQKSNLQLTESQSANTMTALTGAFTVGRGAAIIFIFKIPAQIIFSVNILIVMAANIILVVWANDSETMLWITAILFGLGFSSLMASICVYMERYLNFTNTIGSMMIVSGSLIGSIYPLIVGDSIDYNPVVLSYPIFFSVGVLIIASALAYKITYKTQRRAGG
ncbi:unnamed protein product [Orchesella dallaii]|uniref:Sodium-dependent glucose transporter 1 n=1 Tax=Orchesella dallaii TaxID=48710 RepID=A0ABP1RYM4_9HEXA